MRPSCLNVVNSNVMSFQLRFWDFRGKWSINTAGSCTTSVSSKDANKLISFFFLLMCVICSFRSFEWIIHTFTVHSIWPAQGNHGTPPSQTKILGAWTTFPLNYFLYVLAFFRLNIQRWSVWALQDGPLPAKVAVEWNFIWVTDNGRLQYHTIMFIKEAPLTPPRL